MLKTGMSLIVGITGVLLSAFTTVQDRSATQAGCTLIDRSRPAQSVSYDGRSLSTSEIRLRLHNNTSCSIIVETDDRSPTRLTQLPNGGVRVETVTSPQDGVRLPLHYLIQDRQRWRAPERAYGWGDSVFTYEIPAGQSVVFNVPLSHFQKQLDIVVPFSYAWEGDRSIGMGVGGVVHRVYFLAEDLPKEALRE